MQLEIKVMIQDPRPKVSTLLSNVFNRGNLKLLCDYFYTLTSELWRNMLLKPIIQLGGIIPRLLPPTGGSINTSVLAHKLYLRSFDDYGLSVTWHLFTPH